MDNITNKQKREAAMQEAMRFDVLAQLHAENGDADGFHAECAEKAELFRAIARDYEE